MLFVSKYPANLRPVVSELLFPLVNPLHWREHVFSRTPRESETEPEGTGDVCAAAASEAAASGAALSDFDVPGCRFPAVAP